MSIKRGNSDAGRLDFRGVTSGRKLAPIHPGEILWDDFLDSMKISICASAQAIKMPRSCVDDIVLGRCAITILHFGSPDILALRRSFGSTYKRITTWKSQIEHCA